MSRSLSHTALYNYRTGGYSRPGFDGEWCGGGSLAVVARPTAGTEANEREVVAAVEAEGRRAAVKLEAGGEGVRRGVEERAAALLGEDLRKRRAVVQQGVGAVGVWPPQARVRAVPIVSVAAGCRG